MIVVGDMDPGTPVTMAETIYEQIPGAELWVMPEASHQLPLQWPEDFTDCILDFLDEDDGFGDE